MKHPECELRTKEFPYEYFPDHWGPFEIHDIFPIEKHLKPLDVEFFYICTTPSKSSHPIFLGFDDFAPVWPVDPELSEKAIKRRDKFRERAEFRALVRVKKVKHLTVEGIERLRDAGADVSEAACREGALVVAVTGKYNNFPLYYPDRPRKSGTLFLQYIHQFDSGTASSQHRMAERNLHLCTIDGRTLIRSMLYFERIKLRCFMINTHRENRDAVPVDERDVEWFITKYMEKYPFAETAIRKPKEYRGARKHTSEVRHCFVVHAEWLLHHAGLSSGPDRVINRKVLDKWAAEAPAKREGAARDGRDGWGKWDSQWDRDDVMEVNRKEMMRLKYYMTQIQCKVEEVGSGNEAGDEDGDIEMTPIRSREEYRNDVLTRGGKVKGGNYMHAWIQVNRSTDKPGQAQLQVAEEDELASLDEEDDGSSSKRRKSNSGTSLWSRQSASTRPTSSPSRSGWGYQHPSPSLETRPCPPGAPSPRHNQSFGAGPSSNQSLSGGPRVSFSRSPFRPTSVGPNGSSTRGAGPSGTRHPSGPTKNVEVIVLSSDHDDEPTREHSAPTLNIASSSDEEMGDPIPSPPPSRNLAPPVRVKRESVASSAKLSDRPNRSDDEEVIPDSEAESAAHSSDSESKYIKKSRTPIYTPEDLKRRKAEGIHQQVRKFADVVFYPLEMPESWAPWHCECPPMSMPFSAPQSLSSSHKCKFLIDLRKPSDDVIRLLSNSAEPIDTELRKYLPIRSNGARPWDELSQKLLKRIVELHWAEHYAVWGVKKVLVTQPDGTRKARFVCAEE